LTPGSIEQWQSHREMGFVSPEDNPRVPA